MVPDFNLVRSSPTSRKEVGMDWRLDRLALGGLADGQQAVLAGEET